jgi:hypothetical protein
MAMEVIYGMPPGSGLMAGEEDASRLFQRRGRHEVARHQSELAVDEHSAPTAALGDAA